MTRPARSWDAIAIAPEDDVGVALRDLATGEAARVRVGETVREVPLRSDVPLGHKFALRDLAVGDRPLKYGHPIGAMAHPAATGEHVHIHNLKSVRARAS